MKKIGILGGTFNPVHIGHLVIAQTAVESLKLDSLYFVPSYLPPHKPNENVIDAKKRLAMVRLAVKGNKKFKVSDFEVAGKGKSYSINTVKHFHKKFPKGAKFYFILGEDACLGLNKWKNIDELLNLVTFVVLTRPGKMQKKCCYDIKNIKMPGLDISSSNVRDNIRLGKSIKYLVPLNVERYIEKNHLYC